MVYAPLIIKKIPPKGYHIFTDGKIMGKPIRFLIDTGASKSVVDKNFAETYFTTSIITKTDHQTTGLGTNIPNSNFIRLRRIKIHEKKIRSMQFALLDLNIVNDAYALAGLGKVEAIIGGDILKKYNCCIDYKNAVLLFP